MRYPRSGLLQIATPVIREGFPRWLLVLQSWTHSALRPCSPSHHGSSSSMSSNLHLYRLLHNPSEVHGISIPCLCSVCGFCHHGPRRRQAPDPAKIKLDTFQWLASSYLHFRSLTFLIILKLIKGFVNCRNIIPNQP